MQFQTSDGVDVFYDRAGSGQRTIALLNGIMMTTESWAPILPALTSRFEVLLHDFRGQLRSPDRGPFNIEQHADDLAALLDHAAIDAVDIVGTSYGGEVGMIFAYTYPERVRSLTVIASTSRIDDRMRARTAAAMNAALTEPERLFDVVAHDFYSRDFLRANPEVIERGRTRLAALPREFFLGYSALCDAFTALDITDNLAAIRCPTLVIAGENDTLKPIECSETMANAIDGARVDVIDGAGHAVVIERSGEIARRILDFLG